MKRKSCLGMMAMVILTGCQSGEVNLPGIQIGLYEKQEEEKIVYEEPIVAIYQEEERVLEGVLLEKEGYEALKESVQKKEHEEEATYFIEINEDMGIVFRSEHGGESQSLVDRLYFE